jgi:hypothetical protein
MGDATFDKYEFVNPGKAVFFDRFIAGKFANDLVKDYRKFVSSEYKDNKFLRTPIVNGGFLTNFNLYSSIAFEKFLNSNGMRGIQMGDIERIKSNPNFNRVGIFLGAVYRGIGYPKARQAEGIAKELHANGYNINAQFSDFVPIGMNLSDLEIQFSDNFEKGIGVKLSENAEPFYSKSFHKKHNGMRFSQMNGIGPIPREEMYNGQNILSDGADSGLAKIVYSHGSKLFSSSGKFTDTLSDSRVSIVEKK